MFVNIQLGNKDWKKLGRDAYANNFVSRYYYNYYYSLFLNSLLMWKGVEGKYTK